MSSPINLNPIHDVYGDLSLDIVYTDNPTFNNQNLILQFVQMTNPRRLDMEIVPEELEGMGIIEIMEPVVSPEMKRSEKRAAKRRQRLIPAEMYGVRTPENSASALKKQVEEKEKRLREELIRSVSLLEPQLKQFKASDDIDGMDMDSIPLVDPLVEDGGPVVLPVEENRRSNVMPMEDEEEAPRSNRTNLLNMSSGGAMDRSQAMVPQLLDGFAPISNGNNSNNNGLSLGSNNGAPPPPLVPEQQKRGSISASPVPRLEERSASPLGPGDTPLAFEVEEEEDDVDDLVGGAGVYENGGKTGAVSIPMKNKGPPRLSQPAPVPLVAKNGGGNGRGKKRTEMSESPSQEIGSPQNREYSKATALHSALSLFDSPEQRGSASMLPAEFFDEEMDPKKLAFLKNEIDRWIAAGADKQIAKVLEQAEKEMKKQRLKAKKNEKAGLPASFPSDGVKKKRGRPSKKELERRRLLQEEEERNKGSMASTITSAMLNYANLSSSNVAMEAGLSAWVPEGKLTNEQFTDVVEAVLDGSGLTLEDESRVFGDLSGYFNLDILGKRPLLRRLLQAHQEAEERDRAAAGDSPNSSGGGSGSGAMGDGGFNFSDEMRVEETGSNHSGKEEQNNLRQDGAMDSGLQQAAKVEAVDDEADLLRRDGNDRKHVDALAVTSKNVNQDNNNNNIGTASSRSSTPTKLAADGEVLLVPPFPNTLEQSELVSLFKDSSQWVPVERSEYKVSLADQGMSSDYLREIYLLKTISYPHLQSLSKMEVGNALGKIDLAFRREPKLSEVLEAKIPISFQGAKTIIYQMLCGLYHLHSREVVHGSICLENVSFGSDGKMKLCNWFMLQPAVEEPEVRMCSAPEKVFLGHKLDKLSDLWSCGVVFGSILLNRPLFSSRSVQSQVESTIQLLGCPNERDWPLFGNVASKYKQYHNRYSNLERSFPELKKTRQGFTFLERLLRYDQSKRTPAHRMVRQAFLTEEAPLPSSSSLPEYAKIVEKLREGKEEHDTDESFVFL